ncbi:MAG: hypothetical protein ABI471_02400 [Sphingomonas bacterium]
MKLFTLISAGLVAVAAIVPATASAQMQSSQERHDKRVVTTRTTVRTDNGRHVDMRRNDRHSMRNRHHARRVCKTEWRHHRRVRICRTVRW